LIFEVFDFFSGFFFHLDQVSVPLHIGCSQQVGQLTPLRFPDNHSVLKSQCTSDDDDGGKRESGEEEQEEEEDGEEPQKVCSVITLSSSPYWCLLPILKVYWVQGLRPSILAVT